MTDTDTSAFFAPTVINGHAVKNRLSVAPMTRISATQDGRAPVRSGRPQRLRPVDPRPDRPRQGN